MFAAGGASLRHVDTIARLPATPTARRLAPAVWAGAEAEPAARTADYSPTELLEWGTRLIDILGQDGPGPEDEPGLVNGSAATVTGRLAAGPGPHPARRAARLTHSDIGI